MYSSGYSHVSKTSPQAQKKMQYRSKGKSCGYYLRIIFFFSSLIQSLIIVSLVLFLVYGKTQDSASTTRIQDLEESFSRLSLENVALRQQRKNLTTLLNVTLTEKTRNDWDLLRLRRLSNISVMFIQDLDKKQQQTNIELLMCKNQARLAPSCPQIDLRVMPTALGCELQMERVNAQLELVESNFTQTIQRMKMEMEEIAKDRDNLDLEAIHLRREKAVHLKEIELNTLRCKHDFVQSLSGISNVSRTFLLKIESLFPTHIAFQLTCDKQREHLEQIRTNCTSLSREVEDRFQSYLNSVGSQVSEILSENSRLKAENMRRSDDYRVCSQNRTGMIQEHKQTIQKLQLKHDKDYERILLEKKRLNGDIEVLENSVNYRNKDVELLTEQLRRLNMSCMAKSGFGGLPGAGGGQFGRGGSANFGSNFNSPGFGSNKLGSTGLGSSNPSLGSTGSGLNRLGSTGLGSSSLGSTGSGLNKFGSTGLGSSNPGSSGSGLSRQGSTGLGSSGLGSTGSGINKLGSSGLGSSNPSSTGTGLNKQGSTGLGSSSLGSTGLGLNKLGSTGLGSSSLGSTGSGSNKFGSTGLSSSSLGSTGLGVNKLGSSGTGSSTLGSTGSGLNKLGSNGLGSSTLGSTGLGLNKQSSTGLGSSGLGSTGSGLNKFGSTALGSSGLGSTGSGLNRQGSTSLGTSGLGSTGLGLNRQGSTSLGTSGLGSTGLGLNKQGSTGSMNNKPTSSLKSSSGLGSSGSSSSGFPFLGLGLGNSNTGQSKPGTGIGRGTSSGSSPGMGRTGGLGGGSVSVAQHLQDLQRIINPSHGYEERQELSRMLG
ncbi:plasmalemma vesicle associated protein a [Syngnathus typhle]|uniref:plasmalemma vesicle associated protein a n=1 Tax=Syngnathus typhle TaxID=161592 RepID=UPI002A6B6847|nr:plasmalemma vesicle associated protein a [Syngnathus typhle]